ncbi:MAG: sterol desaturase family protein [Bradymonadaceae bacterium]
MPDVGALNLPDPLILAIPAFLVLILVEIALAKTVGNADFELRDTAASLVMGLGNKAITALTGIVTFAASVWVYDYRLFDLPTDAIWVVVLLFFSEDFIYYWYHRYGHECRWGWASHVNHHSSQHYNLSTGLRQPWTLFFSGGWVLWLPLALVGFHPLLIAFQRSLSLVYQFWVHTETIDRLGPLEWVFSTPSNHRVHHGSNMEYVDRNYGGILIIWDRIFGTYQREKPDEPVEYGLIDDLGSFHPIRIAFHEWVSMWRDIRDASSWKHRLMYMFGPPGWSPDDSKKTVAELRAEQKTDDDG